MSSERQILNMQDPWWGEHIHRYHEVLHYIDKNDSILDMACGTGFGTAILADYTQGKVTGGDIAEDAIAECRRQWVKSNIDFRVLDGTQLNFNSRHFDVIVSFETIEHTSQYRKMAEEFARVLKPGGRLILSTPNSQITSPDGIVKNSFHTQEFRYDELKAILKDFFNEVSIFGQYYSRYDRQSFKRKAGAFFEKICLSFGFRKIPYYLRNGFMKFFFGYPLYPVAEDFFLELDVEKIKTNCPVLFAVCKKDRNDSSC